jgi:serine protein kinase
VFRHRFTGKLLTTIQPWGVLETTPNHSIYDRSGQTFYPEQRHEIMALRAMDYDFAAAGAPHAIDLGERIEGLEAEEVLVGAGAATPARPGWARFWADRSGASVRVHYDPLCDVHATRDLLTVLVWSAALGETGKRAGVETAIEHPSRGELERVLGAFERISSDHGRIVAGNFAAWRLEFSSPTMTRILSRHVAIEMEENQFPDFLFGLPSIYLQYALDELRHATGHEGTEDAFSFPTSSAVLAAQVGTLATLLGKDYRITRAEGEKGRAVYRVDVGAKASGDFRPELRERNVENEWVYDIECVGLHNFVCGVGNVVAHNTNEPEYRRLQNNEFMEALRDRTVKIDVPYVTRLSDEIKIYEKDFNTDRVKGKHIAPHTIEIAAMWAVLTRLETPKHANLTLLQKLKLYNGKTLPGFTPDNVTELKREAANEGMHGISPRYIQDKISNAIVAHPDEDCVNPFMVLHELEAGLRHHSLITSQEQLQHFRELLAVVKEEYEDIVKNEVQRAIAADEDALSRLCSNYIDNVRAYTQREKVRNRITGNYDEPDERLMRSVEEKIDIPEGRKDDFRREIMNYIGALALDGKRFDYKTNERLQKALELKLFEDQKDTIKLTSLVSNVVDKATQEKIDIVKSRLIRNYGYNESSATDVLTYVASIFARGHTKK